MFPLRDNIPTERFPLVTVALIVANVIVYVFFQDGRLGLPDNGFGGDWPTPTYALIPCEVTGSDPCQTAPGGPSTIVTLFTSMFMHGSILHLGGNMLFLWIFGNNVEDSMGPIKFILFYVLGGLAADAGQILVDSGSDIPTLGASGAVAGVLGGYLVLFPRARVVTLVFIIFFFTILELPAIFFLGIWFLQQALFGYLDLFQPSGGGGGVAYFAHIGGFVFGLLAIRLFASERRRRRQLDRAGLR
ncbi:MAG TPA: rhomboid family intramembrane serine protease [Solirubrobacteraceae bacterium]|nr:rhomboid family intramembrane serine protease [Solirubrobacteraceae bacterium]